MAELHHECGIAAVYHLKSDRCSSLIPSRDPDHTSRLIPRLLLDIQNRGQLAAGMTTYNSQRRQIIDTHKDVGTVSEVFRLNHQLEAKALSEKYSGNAAIGHVRYATCGKDDKSYAQPFERHHLEKPKWFSFGFNGQLANYPELRSQLLKDKRHHLARETDTEILMHLLSKDFSLNEGCDDYFALLSRLAEQLDGAYNIVFLNAMGDMFVSRDPLGIRPLCFAIEDDLFAAASESVALLNLGFSENSIRDLPPGQAIVIRDGEVQLGTYSSDTRTAHCFFEWIYFANVASTLDARSVYLTRKRLGEELASQEQMAFDNDTIVVPVPDTAKAAASSMAYELNLPCLEGLMRNRYVGRTFIEGGDRLEKVKVKYTPLREVLHGKRVILVEDTIVRSTTMRGLVQQIFERGGAREIHIRVACPPIVAPCFYGIDMSTIDELFAPEFLENGQLTADAERRMADELGATSLRYLPAEAIARSIQVESDSLCEACVGGPYPTAAGKQLHQLAIGDNVISGDAEVVRTYETALTMPART